MRFAEKLLRGAWRAWLRFRHQRGGDDGACGPVIEHVAGRPLVVLPSVFNPRLFRSGAFLAESLHPALVPRDSLVLELGTGTGIGAIAAAEWAREVVAVDVNPQAVRSARINVLLNGLERIIDVRDGDLFEPVAARRFDVVLFNPPYFRGEPKDDRDKAWRSPDLDHRLADELSRHLTPGGWALLCLSTDGDLDFADGLAHAGYTVEAVAERDLLNEVLRLYRVVPSS